MEKSERERDEKGEINTPHTVSCVGAHRDDIE